LLSKALCLTVSKALEKSTAVTITNGSVVMRLVIICSVAILVCVLVLAYSICNVEWLSDKMVDCHSPTHVALPLESSLSTIVTSYFLSCLSFTFSSFLLLYRYCCVSVHVIKDLSDF